jgi:hypothetical protein
VQVLPCVVGSDATLSTLVSQVTAAYNNADTGSPLDEMQVKTSILDMAARKAHSGRVGAKSQLSSRSTEQMCLVLWTISTYVCPQCACHEFCEWYPVGCVMP